MAEFPFWRLFLAMQHKNVVKQEKVENERERESGRGSKRDTHGPAWRHKALQ